MSIFSYPRSGGITVHSGDFFAASVIYFDKKKEER